MNTAHILEWRVASHAEVPNDQKPVVLTETQAAKLIGISHPRSLRVDWQFSQDAFDRLRLGHRPTNDADKWFMAVTDSVFRAYRSWSHAEIFRMTLLPTDDGGQVARVVVEQDPAKLELTDETMIQDMVIDVLKTVMGLDTV